MICMARKESDKCFRIALLFKDLINLKEKDLLISDKLNSSTIHVIPASVPAASVHTVGSWSHFNITWQPSVEVNHGNVSYELSVEVDDMMRDILVKLFYVYFCWLCVHAVTVFVQNFR